MSSYGSVLVSFLPAAVACQREDVANISSPYAHFSLELGREVNSLEVITEIDPFAFEEIFGEIGGAWGK